MYKYISMKICTICMNIQVTLYLLTDANISSNVHQVKSVHTSHLKMALVQTFGLTL